MSQILKVVTAFGPFVLDQIISDPTQVAAILAGPNIGDVTDVSGAAGTSVPLVPSSPFATHAEVDAEIATALTAAGLPAGATVPALVAQGIAAHGSGSGISAGQSILNALIFG